MESIIGSFVKVAPYINQLTSSDFAVSVCDTEKCVAYIPSEKLDHGLQPGEKHIEGATAWLSIKEKEKLCKELIKKFLDFRI